MAVNMIMACFGLTNHLLWIHKRTKKIALFAYTLILIYASLLPKNIWLAQTHHRTKTSAKLVKNCKFGFSRSSMPQSTLLWPNKLPSSFDQVIRKRIKEALLFDNSISTSFELWIESLGIHFSIYKVHIFSKITNPRSYFWKGTAKTHIQTISSQRF